VSDSRLKRIADWTARLGLPAAVLIILLAVFFGEQISIHHELSLLAPSSAVRGQSLPVRVMVLTDLAATTGPRIVSLPVDVTLRANDADGPVLLEQRLEASPAGGADGVIQVPSDAPSTVVLRAVGHLEGRGVATVSRVFELDEPGAGAEMVGRLAQATAHFSEGALELVPWQVAPSILTSRVVGGACVPESPCELLVRVGAPAALIRLAPTPAITVHQSPSSPAEGLVRVVFTVHGPDAEVTVEASRDSVVVARRSVRLPVALATPGLVVRQRLRPPTELELNLVGEPPGLIVDAYAGGRWLQTGSIVPGDGPIAMPFGLDGPSPSGLWRLQVRTDPFSARRAASRIFLGGLDVDEGIAELNRLADAPDASPPDGPDELRFAWAAAAMEIGHYDLPETTRGFREDQDTLDQRRRTLRLAALVAMVLGLLVLAVLLLRRGFGAAREAQRVMEATGDPALASASHRRRTLLSALAIVATMLLAFVAATAMIIARAHLLE